MVSEKRTRALPIDFKEAQRRVEKALVGRGLKKLGNWEFLEDRREIYISLPPSPSLRVMVWNRGSKWWGAIIWPLENKEEWPIYWHRITRTDGWPVPHSASLEARSREMAKVLVQWDRTQLGLEGAMMVGCLLMLEEMKLPEPSKRRLKEMATVVAKGEMERMSILAGYHFAVSKWGKNREDRLEIASTWWQRFRFSS
jgi:hypothetical protein